MQSVPAVHRMTASPSGRTVYVLSAANAEGRSSDQKAVDPVNSGGAGVDFPFGANIHCPGFASAAPLIFSVPAGTVSPSLRITSVVPRAEAGVLVSVSGPGSGDRVDGGTWYVRAQPPVGPRCRYGTHDYPPPETFWISLTVTAACR